MHHSFSKSTYVSTLLAMLVGLTATSHLMAQPTFGNPSPTSGSSTSDKANAAADAAAYKEIEYTNRAIKGPALVVIPGEVKSNNASFIQKFGPNNIADFAELELSNANFKVLERNNLGNLLQEVSLAYNLGDVAAARKTMKVGKLKTTQWIVKFDILKAEQIAENKKGFDGRAVGGLLSMFGGGVAGSVASQVTGSVQTNDSTGVWLIGMRYKIMDANTTEQVAQGYKDLKMEVGNTQTSVMGVSEGAKGGVGLDTMVQRLVQTLVWDIDAKHK
jgi:curli biogenesis system outer membrane secretion channel CsgG